MSGTPRYRLSQSDEEAIAKADEVFRGQFMQPRYYQGVDVQEALMHQGDMDIEDDKVYCRLSAAGYMDATDYSGPFDSVTDAAEHLIGMYGGADA